MNNQHPIKPTLKQVERWFGDAVEMMSFATAAVQWGADQQLDACVHWFVCENEDETADALYDACRPKPPSLKEQAITALHAVVAGANDTREQQQDLDTIRTALEALPND